MLSFEFALIDESDMVLSNEMHNASGLCSHQSHRLISTNSSHLQPLLTNTNNLIPTNKRIKLLPLPVSPLIPHTAIILQLLIANLLQLELAVLATINGPEGIDAVLLKRSADLHAFDVAVAAAAVVVERESFEGEFVADGGDGADGVEEEVFVKDDVAAGVWVQGGG